jgi:hypothetical protein
VKVSIILLKRTLIGKREFDRSYEARIERTNENTLFTNRTLLVDVIHTKEVLFGPLVIVENISCKRERGVKVSLEQARKKRKNSSSLS